jgi:hypothetical protein
MITLLLLIPVLGSIFLLLIDENKRFAPYTGKERFIYQELKMKRIALTTSLINLFISLII